MKKLLLPWVLLVLALLFMSAIPLKDCHCKGIPLYGRVKVVEHGADFEVRVLERGTDLNVKIVERGADACGEWQFVEYSADFTIRYVEYGGDFTIRFVERSPGQNTTLNTMP